MNGIAEHALTIALSIVLLGTLCYHAWRKFSKRDLVITGFGLILFVIGPLAIECVYDGRANDGGWILGVLLIPAYITFFAGICLIVASTFLADKRGMEGN
ncbi:MAG: hypothetical protein OXU92_05275 [Deltaproteobacteria bacterium]|nr:hypothetical protein [Deltaproteobacteria bacterium]